MSYLHRTGESEPDAPAIRQAADQAADWLLRQQLSTGPMAGLLTGGWDQAGVEGGTRLPFASTEHNLDAWHALSRAGEVLNCQRCTAAANTLHDAILAILWDSSGGGFLQGMQPDGPDRVEPLDVNSWGSIFLDAIGRPDLAATSLGRTAAFAVSDQSLSGYLAFRPQPTMPEPGAVGMAGGVLRGGPRPGPARWCRVRRHHGRPGGGATSGRIDADGEFGRCRSRVVHGILGRRHHLVHPGEPPRPRRFAVVSPVRGDCRTERPLTDVGSSAGWSTGTSGSAKVNVVPSPTVLATRMLPWCATAIAWVMVRPNPTPGTANWVAVDARKNRENSRSISSAGMPIPVSLTEMSAISRS